MSTERVFFPMLVRLEGRKCLVVGAGKVAANKIAGLLSHGAQVVVVSPRAARRVQSQARAGLLTWRRRTFSPSDVDGVSLVIAATNSPIVNEAIFLACSARGVLCNAVDDPERCDFFYPAVVRRGPLQIAISTSGCSPALASRLRRELEQQFGPEWGAWVEHVGKMRCELLNQIIPPASRRKRLLQMSSAKAFRDFVRSRSGAKGKATSRHRPANGKPGKTQAKRAKRRG